MLVYDSVFVHTCTNTDAFEVADNLVIALTRYVGNNGLPAGYVFYEPDVHNVEAYRATDANLDAIAGICGVDVEDVDDNAYCPSSHADNDTCFEYSAALEFRPLKLVFCVCIFIVQFCFA